MVIEGGCYCGALRYRVEGDPLFKGECFCRECQYSTGGNPNLVMGMPGDKFSWEKGEPKAFERSDLDAPVRREFCGDCGTQMLSRTPAIPGAVLIKVGSFDDPAVFEGPQMAIFLVDKQPFHQVREGIATFERTPG